MMTNTRQMMLDEASSMRCNDLQYEQYPQRNYQTPMSEPNYQTSYNQSNIDMTRNSSNMTARENNDDVEDDRW